MSRTRRQNEAPSVLTKNSGLLNEQSGFLTNIINTSGESLRDQYALGPRLPKSTQHDRLT